MSTKQEMSDLLAQSMERVDRRFREQFKKEQMAIYKARLKKKAEQKEAEEKAADKHKK